MGFGWYVTLAVICMIVTEPFEADATCVNEQQASGTEVGLVLHLPASCSPDEREAYAVPGETVIDAIAKGWRVDLVGVIIRGELNFDRLGSKAAEGSNESENERRFVLTALRIRDSDVQGALRHRSLEGVLRFQGPVDFQGSRFREGVDLSRSVFQGRSISPAPPLKRKPISLEDVLPRKLFAGKRSLDPVPDFIDRCFRGCWIARGPSSTAWRSFLK